MGQIIIPGDIGGGGSQIAIGAEVLAYYRFEETENLTIAIDSAMNFDAVVPEKQGELSSRTIGKIGQGLLCVKTVANFDANMLLDEIPSTYKANIEMWFKLNEAIVKGEHATYTLFSKQWASGMKLYCYLISRLESVALRICFSYSNLDPSAETVLFAGASGGSFLSNGIYYKASDVKYIQAIDSTWTIEYVAAKWQVRKRDIEGEQVTHFERSDTAIAGAYVTTINGEGIDTSATALASRTDEYEIPCGEQVTGIWHKLHLLLDLRDDYLSKFGIYLDDQYAGGDTAYVVDLPLNTDISPDLLGGDAANVKIAVNDSTIPYVVDGYPLPSSHRFGISGVIDEVIVRRIFTRPILGGHERPRLFLTSEGLGTASADPVKADYDHNEEVILTAVPDEEQAFSHWLINGVNMGATNPYTLTMTPGDKYVIAVFGGKVATPTANPAGGNYNTAQSIVLSCITEEAEIYYTLDGSPPTSGSTLYTTPISISSGKTLKAIGIKGGLIDSNIMTEIYTFTLLAPIFNPDGGNYGEPIDVVMTSTMTGASIRYTDNGSEPTSESTLYTEPVNVSEDVTLKAKAFKTDCTTSATKTGIYNLPAWVRKTDWSAILRQGMVGFNIGTKGYAGTGGVWGSPTWGSSLFREYNPATNAWLTKAYYKNYSVSGVTFASGFSIGTKGYIGCGRYGDTHFRDFWEYNPTTNLWTEKASLPGDQSGRWKSYSFSDGTYGYIGGGDRIVEGLPYYFKDLWRYDPGTNSWLQRADCPVAFSHALVLWIGSKAYVMCGLKDGSTLTGQVYEYNPTENSWTLKGNLFPGVHRYGCSGFASATKGYLIGSNYTAQSKEVWEYTPGTDSWVQLDDFPGDGRWFATAFVISGNGYFGTGYDGSVDKKDFWQFLEL